MIYYVLDTSVIIPNYFQSPDPAKTPAYLIKKDIRIREVFAYICSQWIAQKAILIVPNFVIAEVLNYFASSHFRGTNKTPNQAKKDYEELRDKFIGKVKYNQNQTLNDRKGTKRWFFNYELNRHHILSLDRVFPIEHTTEPIKKEPNVRDGYTHLSPFDLLLISVAIELEVLVGSNKVFLLTLERRMKMVCDNGSLPKCYKVDDINNPKEELPDIKQKEEVVIPSQRII